MKNRFSQLACIILVLAGHTSAAEPSVTNVRAAQKPGTKKVDVWYDVAGTTSPVYVSLQVSEDGGSSYAVPVSAVSGDVGSSITLGRNKKITWDAGVDWNGKLSTTMRFKVTASDTPLAPQGFVTIPAGNFMRGAEPGVTGTSVYVSAFALQKTEVTKEQWDAVRTWGSTHGYTDLSVGGGKGTNHPVHTVSWYDVVKWCNAKSEMEGKPVVYTVGGATYKTGNSTPVINYAAKGYRLPTEAEREKAARGGLSGKRFPWGDEITHSLANYHSSSSYSYDTSPTRDYHPTYNGGSYPYTSPVGSFAANGYGLFDMAGNVNEWCNDWYGTYAGSNDPTGPATGSGRVHRGGGWNLDAALARCAAHYGNNPTYTSRGIGFRPALGQ
ncbi:MAG: SUMF1/EgtB/PvdO family nonheme iron enzyme [Akkermansiaceae bacterium]|nr:SUMF1/EgtB/PvdO family nonheme iron enzyme [Akkermansiaceae bacterium]